MKNSRRDFLIKTAVTGSALMAAPSIFGVTGTSKLNTALDASAPFKLKYAPTLTMFPQHVGKDPIENIKFCHDMGFRAMYELRIWERPVAEQEKIVNEMARLGMEFGPFVALSSSIAPSSFVLNKPEVRELLTNKMIEMVEVYKRTGIKWGLVSLGDCDLKLHKDFQTANAIDNLRRVVEIAEKAGLILVLEPLNTLHDHPGKFLNGIPQAYSICRAINSPSCKIVEDFYHQQITEGNLIPNLEAAWSEIASFHTGDNPGRNEPTTGEINYKNIFKFIYNKKYEGVICLEHGFSNKTKEGEARVIQAYRECDSFEV